MWFQFWRKANSVTKLREEIRRENLGRITSTSAYVRSAGTHSDSELRRLRARIWSNR